MKISTKHITIFLILIAFTLNSIAQSTTIKGYTIKGDIITFVFKVDDYPNIKYNGHTIKQVFVSGEFNDWATNQWEMQKVTDTRYELKKSLHDFTSDFDWEFKFVVNGEHWAEPSRDFVNSVTARDKNGKKMMVYNLKLYSAFATDYGNVSFKLKGFTDATKVILSGTFNRWDETGFKMKPTADGWQVTLQLRPDIYEYKFIVDGQWMVDPQNPSKILNKYEGYNSVINVKRRVEFRLCEFGDAQTVILAGDFNDWSEHQFKMKKTNNCWTYSTLLSGGKYHYKFIVDGKWMIDPANSVAEYDGKGNVNSVCMIK
ncbi:glycogen-binding domain-containing protein [Winogradskyella haliclonae]|uniref:AMP-activated protein kinase glycogen-binding domain-containing protein n=1 Tax=Winogradskyella haliclonae TaxID=2048558 RepID=A0ABQ2BYQ6_9FLAO|nr:glycogen-binding domain-containing protein [Winogradskyella haliclonae]GGI57649.1 hypothetical protein GCM10011444_19580 [Winogradskyella haliclonae]